MEALTCNLMLHVPEQGVACSQLLLLNLAVQLQETNNHGTDPVIIKGETKKLCKLHLFLSIGAFNFMQVTAVTSTE